MNFKIIIIIIISISHNNNNNESDPVARTHHVNDDDDDDDVCRVRQIHRPGHRHCQKAILGRTEETIKSVIVDHWGTRLRVCVANEYLPRFVCDEIRPPDCFCQSTYRHRPTLCLSSAYPLFFTLISSTPSTHRHARKFGRERGYTMSMSNFVVTIPKVREASKIVGRNPIKKALTSTRNF